MSTDTLYQWMKQIRDHMPAMTQPQARVLALFSLGIVLARRCTLSIVAEHLGRYGKADSVERRLQRWLANGRLVMAHCCQWWTRWVLRSLVTGPVYLLVDETKLGRWLGVMVVGIAYRGRCIPLAWRCYRPTAYPEEGQVRLIEALLHVVDAGLPVGCRPLLQADRGIGTSPTLVRAVERLPGWGYLFRVQGTTRLRTPDGTVCAMRDKVRRGQSWSGRAEVFKKAGWLPTYVHLIWKPRFDAPWCLITNRPNLKGAAYACRVWQEESFRDLKSGGFLWDRSQVRTPQHAERLLLALALAYAWMLTLGLVVIRDHAKSLRRQLTRGKRRTFSVFRLGLRYLSHLIHSGQPICCGLIFVPHQPLF